MAQLKLSFSKIKKFSLVLDLIFGIILLGIVLWKTDIWFETNDDHYIMDILIG